MNCNCKPTCPEDKCLSSLTFKIDGTDIVPRLNGVPLDPIDLKYLVRYAETDTRLQLDSINKQLIYTSESAANNVSSPDSISISTLASLINLQDLGDVDFPFATDGDIISWDSTLNKWVSYTIPSGTIVTPVGVDADGKLVKSGGAGPAPVPGATPLGGIIIWPALPNQLPVDFRECNGQALSRTVYSDLFDLIGTTYGAGDGGTSFNLPNMQTRTVTGLSSTGTIDTQFNVIGQTGGAKTVALTSANNGPHSHGSTSAAGSHTHGFTRDVVATSSGGNQRAAVGGSGQQLAWSVVGMSAAGNHTHSIPSSGSGTPHNNLQPYITMPYAMRVI